MTVDKTMDLAKTELELVEMELKEYEGMIAALPKNFDSVEEEITNTVLMEGLSSKYNKTLERYESLLN